MIQLAFSDCKISSKQQAMNLFEKTRPNFLAYCREVAIDLLKRQKFVTIDDIRDVVGMPPKKDKRAYGAVFHDDRFVKLGETITRVKTSHGRNIAMWGLKHSGHFGTQ